MKKLYLLPLILLVFAIPQVYSAANTSISSIITDIGTVTATPQGVITLHGNNGLSTNSTGSSVNLNLKIIGDKFITVNQNETSTTISQTRFYKLSDLNQIVYDGLYPQPYIADLFSFQSQYADNVPHYEPLAGSVSYISVSVVKNTLNQQAKLELFINDINTGSGITILPKDKSTIITQIATPFNKGDNVYWKIITTDPSPNSLMFNGQVLIWYQLP